MAKKETIKNLHKVFVTWRVYSDQPMVWHDQMVWLTDKQISRMVQGVIKTSNKNVEEYQKEGEK